jgi:hypothetical protein|tara:strand:- start:408 stop:617 length:210 start_codon:yes stop_codon:yes gene_type:complete
MNTDWRYSEQKLALREQALRVLFTKYGSNMKECVPEHSAQSIYECAHDWISQGNVTTSGIINYYKAYYS